MIIRWLLPTAGLFAALAATGFWFFTESDLQSSPFLLDRTGGFSCHTFTDEAGESHQFILFVPYELTDADRPPLLLFLNGIGENGNDGLMQIAQNFGLPIWEFKRRFPFVVVAPQCHSGQKWRRESHEGRAALQLVSIVSEKLRTDPDRVYLTAVSSGATGVWDIAGADDGTFAAIVPLCAPQCGGSIDELAKQLADAHIPIWSFYNEFDDLPGVVETNKNLQAALLRAGASPLVTVYPQPWHNCWDKAYRTPALYQWMLEQSRSQNRAGNSLFRPLFDLTEPESILFRREDKWRILSQDAGEASLEAGNSELATTQLEGDASDDFELHLEFEFAGSRDARLSLHVDRDYSKSESASSLVIRRTDTGRSSLSLQGVANREFDFSPLVEHTLSADRWNDVRIARHGKQLSVHINGWLALRVDDDRDNRLVEFFSLQSGHDEAPQPRWRRIRFRRS